MGTVTARNIDPEADGKQATAVVAGMNSFAADLFRQVAANEPGNVVLGPYSAASALGMIYAGASGTTAAEMAAVLHDTLPPGEWHEGYNAYDLSLNARTAGSPSEWLSANKVWAVPGLDLREEFLDILTAQYGSPLAEADFAADPERQRQLINDWVADVTSGRITELFPAGSLSHNTVMALVNAVALTAPWEFPFDPVVTAPAPFNRPDGSIALVPTMQYHEYLPSMYSEQVVAVELPYGGGALSMIVMVPADYAAFEATLDAEVIASISGQLRDGGIHLALPKWTARTHQQLNDELTALGMPSAFGAGADFSGMVDGDDIWLSTVEHEAFIEVDEQGTRAAAATGGAMVASHGPTVTVDRPFVYVIADRGAGTILFIGRVLDPTA